MERVYLGIRNEGEGPRVSVVEGGVARPLPLRLDLKDASPGGFEWGYGSQGPAQLALAILADATENDGYALRHHHWFKLEIVSKLPWRNWKLTHADVMGWIREHHPLAD